MGLTYTGAVGCSPRAAYLGRLGHGLTLAGSTDGYISGQKGKKPKEPGAGNDYK
jgi:hypothetical protein